MSDEERQPFTRQQSLTLGLGTLLTVGAVDLLAHLGPTGLVVGGIAAYVAARHGPEIVEQLREVLPALPARHARPLASSRDADEDRNIPGVRGRSLLDRALGRFPDERPGAQTSGARDECDRADVLSNFSRETQLLDHDWETELLPPPRAGEMLLFSSVLEQFSPAASRIFLARSLDGGDLTCSAQALCHVALAGSTGGGKSSILRMLLLQLCQARMQVLLLNPHYTRYDIENDEDWTPFEPYLAHPPMECRKYEVVEHFLQVAAKDLIPKRLERRARSLPVGTPYFIAIDELPSIIREIKAAPEYMRIILEEGRKVGVFLISAAQDFLVKTISPNAGGGSIRECYRTAYYVGGDPTTARVLLDMPATLIPEDELGKGVVMLRASASKKATKVFVPYVDNASLYHLLGPSTYTPTRSVQEAAPGSTLSHEEHATTLPSRDMILETIVTLSAAGTLDESMLMKLIEQLPPVRADESMQEPPQEMRSTSSVSYLHPVPRPSEEGPGMEQAGSSAALPQRTSRHQEKFARYIAIWQALEEKQSATLRDFAKAAGLNEGKAYTYLSQMADAGLIRWERRKKQAL